MCDIYDYFILDCDCPPDCSEKEKWPIGSMRSSYTRLCNEGVKETHCANGHKIDVREAVERTIDREGNAHYVFDKKLKAIMDKEFPSRENLKCGICGEKMYLAKKGVLHYLSEMDARCAEKMNMKHGDVAFPAYRDTIEECDICGRTGAPTSIHNPLRETRGIKGYGLKSLDDKDYDLSICLKCAGRLRGKL